MKDDAEDAVFSRVERAVDGIEHPALLATAAEVGRALDELKEAVAFLDRAPQEVRLLQARRLAGSMADVVQATLLLDEARRELERKGSARNAVVARYFAESHLAGRPLRGIASGDRITGLLRTDRAL